jgi:dynein heavy chain 1
VEAQRYDRFRQGEQSQRALSERTYQSLILKMSQPHLNAAYEALEKHLKEAEDYVKTWKSYQTLWDIEAGEIYKILGDNIDKWHQLLNEIRQGRKTFENSELEKAFGPVVIYYGGVQQKVNNKYDQWHKEILNKFGLTLGEGLRGYNKTVQTARRQLEKVSIDGSDDVTLFVTDIQEMKRNVTIW